MKTIELLRDAFSELDNRNFTRKRLIWCRTSGETLFSVDLQKSKYGERYYTNVGVWFLGLGAAQHRPPHRCHFYGRFDTDESARALDFDSEAAIDRAEVLREFVLQDLLAVADECGTASGAASFFGSGALRVPLVLPEARGMLGIGQRR